MIVRLPFGLLALLPLCACTPTPASQFNSQSGTLPEDQSGPPIGAASVLTSHNDLARTGQNLFETALSPATVSPATFGKRYSVPVDGVVYAQPLVVLGLQTDAGARDVLYVATSHDSVYALDTDAGAPLWQVSLLGQDETTVPSADVNSSDISPEIGITGTPVIDPISRTLYVVAKSKATGPKWVQRLHALDLETGAERAGSPVEIVARVDGEAPDAVDGGVNFLPLRQLQRPGLLLSKGVVWLAFGSHGDTDPYHGWLLGYDAHTLKRTAVFNATPDGSEGSIWQGGAGPAADEAGLIYLATANGDFDADEDGRDYGDSVLVLKPNNGAVVDWFTPFDQERLANFDLDLGSGGPMLLPDQPGANPHLLIATSKGGVAYVLDRDNLGHYQEDSNDQIVSQLTVENSDGAIHPLAGAPAYWNGQVYLSASKAPLRAYTVAQGQLYQSSQSTMTLPSSTASISADGTQGALAWVIESRGSNSNQPAVLHAFDATDLSQEVYSSDQFPLRDQAGNASTFAVPTIAAGRVYVGTTTEVDVYGLLP